MRRVRWWLLLLVAGCGRNAILEVELDDTNTDSTFVTVELAEIDPTTMQCGTFSVVLPRVALASRDELSVVPVSLETDHPRPVCVRMTLAHSTSADTICGPFTFRGSPWVMAERTHWHLAVSTHDEMCTVVDPVVDTCSAICCGDGPCCTVHEPGCTRCTSSRDQVECD